MTPGLVIAAPRSGSGKTMLTLGLLRAFARRGLAVAGAKCGPDYIDPAFHAAATGRPSVNLDSWAMPPDLIDDLAARAGAGCDLLICEGLMGLFDGVPGEAGRSGSSADVAAALGWPVVLIHDVGGQAQSAAAQIFGCATYDPRITIAGVVLNRVGSARHRRLVGEALAALGLPVLGALPRAESAALPERHLGLVQAQETAGLDARLDALADLVEAHVDLDQLRVLAGTPLLPAGEKVAEGRMRAGSSLRERGEGDNFEGDRTDPRPEPPAARGLIPLRPPGQRIAVARDAAFSFLYPHVAEGWRAAGADLLFFSPLADEPPPPACDACWLPGGYPELHAGRIAAATRFLDGLRAVAQNRPVHGECGGYMVLGTALTDAEGVAHPMAGLLGVETSFARRRLHLGYRDATLRRDGVLGPAGARLRGHEFHYATVIAPGGDEPFAEVTDAYGGAPEAAGGRRNHVTGSFFHAIAASQ